MKAFMVVLGGGLYNGFFHGLLTMSSVYMVIFNILIPGANNLDIALNSGLLVGISSFALYMLEHKAQIIKIESESTA